MLPRQLHQSHLCWRFDDLVRHLTVAGTCDILDSTGLPPNALQQIDIGLKTTESEATSVESHASPHKAWRARLNWRDISAWCDDGVSASFGSGAGHALPVAGAPANEARGVG